MKCISYVNSCVPYWCTQGERGLSLSGSITVRNGDGPTGTDSVKEDICDWQSVSWESGKRRMTFLWREVSAHGGAEKATVSPPLRWLLLSCTRKLSAIFQEDSPSFNLPLSFCLSATSPPPRAAPVCLQCHPTSLLPPSSLALSLSAAVKSDRLQVCYLSERRFTAAVGRRALAVT